MGRACCITGVSARPQASPRSSRASVTLASLAIVAFILLAYANSFQVPFLFDDAPAILENPAVRPPHPTADLPDAGASSGETTRGRPVVRLSLAVNFRLTGEKVGSYHVVNLVIHGLAALTLLGVLRRTLARQWRVALEDPGRGSTVTWLAAAVAALWALHPLQTEAVTYVVQRAESLMALFYLLTLYAFLRAADAARPLPWLAGSVVWCALGMATKEVMVSAPLTILLYDRALVGGTFREAWRRRWKYHLALATTWVILAGLVLSTEGRGGTAGFATLVTPWQYLLTQCRAIGQYLRLAVWPHPLVFDYGTAVVHDPADVFFPAAGLLMLATVVLWALWRRAIWGLAGFWFFAILAPSSSIVPIASQTMAEHRMYLPLVAVIAAGVLMLHRTLGRRSLVLCGLLIVAGGILTWRRNADYRSEEVLWADTVAKHPTNARAHHNLGRASLNAGRVEEAMTHFQTALRLQPRAAETHYNLGVCLARRGRTAEAITSYQAALALEPRNAEAHNNLGNALLKLGRVAEARAHYEEAVRSRPGLAEPHSNLGNVLLQLGHPEPALRQCAEALRLNPNYAEAHYNAGNACAELHRLPEARSHYEAALATRPDYAMAHNNLANVLLEFDQLPDALAHYQTALRLDSAYLEPCRNLALLLMHLGRHAEALPYVERLSAALPHDPEISRLLAQARAAARR